MTQLSKAKARSVDNQEGADFTPLPDGLYRAKLLSVDEAKPRSGGDLYWKTTWQITQPNTPKRKVFENISMGETSEWKVKQFFEAFGVSARTNTDELLGEEAILQLTSGVIQKGPNAGQERNEVAAILPLSAAEDDDEDDEDIEYEEDDDEEEDDEEEEDADVEDEDEVEEEDDDEDEPPPPPSSRSKKGAASSSTARSSRANAASPVPASGTKSASRSSSSAKRR